MATAKTKIELLIESRVRDAINDLKKTDREIDNISNSGKKLNNVFSGVGTAMKAFVSVLAVREVADFAIQTAKLAGEAESLRRSLRNLGQKEGTDTVKLMQDLRKATADTVSDIELMRNATQAKFLGIDLKNLPVLFEFARRRAQDTGQSIDYLVNSIVTGIGRKSPLILDNLGLQMRDLDAEVERIARSTGTWTGQVDENLRALHLQEAAVNIAREGIAESGEDVETAASSVARLNAQWENFQIIIGRILSGPTLAVLTYINDLLAKIGGNLDVILADSSVEKFMLLAQKDLADYQKQLADIDAQLAKLGTRSGVIAAEQLGLTPSQLRASLEAKRKVLLEDIRLTQEIIESSQQSLAAAGGDGGGGGAGAGGGDAEALRKNQEDVLDLRVEVLRRIDEMEAFFVEKKLERLDEAQMAELDAVIETTDAIIEEISRREAAEQERLFRQVELYRQVAGIVSNAFVGLASDLADSASTGSEAWSNFFNRLKQQIIQFLASQAIKALLTTLGNLIFPGAGSIIGGILGFQHGGFVKGSPGGQLVRVGENNTDELIVPLNSPALPALTPPALTNPAGGGLSQLIERVTTNNTEKVVRVLVETADPGFTRIRQHYIDVNRNILRNDNKYADQFLQTKKSKFED